MPTDSGTFWHRRFRPGAQVVNEETAGRSSCLAVAAEGVNFEEAIGGVIGALREYADDWHDHLLNAPNHRDCWGLVQLISLNDDDQLRIGWLETSGDGSRSAWSPRS